MVVPMVAQAVMVNVRRVKASAAMAVAMKVVPKAATHGVAVAVNAVQSVALNVVQSAVTKPVQKIVRKVVQKVATKVVAHVMPTAPMVAVHAKKPVQMLKTG